MRGAARAASELRLLVWDRTIGPRPARLRLGLSPGLRSKETVELLQMGDEIAAALGRAGMDDELARDVIERPQHRDLLGLRPCSAGAPAQVRLRLRPGAGEIGMGERLALVAVEKNNVARFRLLFASSCRRRPTRSTSLSV